MEHLDFFIGASVVAFECEVKSKPEDLLWVSKKEGKEVEVGLRAKNILKCMILFLRTRVINERERKAWLKQHNVLRGNPTNTDNYIFDLVLQAAILVVFVF